MVPPSRLWIIYWTVSGQLGLIAVCFWNRHGECIWTYVHSPVSCFMSVGCRLGRVWKTSASSPLALSRAVDCASWTFTHTGNQSSSPEEAEVVSSVVRSLIGEGAT